MEMGASVLGISNYTTWTTELLTPAMGLVKLSTESGI